MRRHDRQEKRYERMRQRAARNRRKERRERRRAIRWAQLSIADPEPATDAWFVPERDLPAWFHVLSQLNPYMRFAMYGARVA